MKNSPISISKAISRALRFCQFGLCETRANARDLTTHGIFWQEHPALLYSLTLLIGMAAALFWNAPWNLAFATLWGIYLLFIKKWPLCFLLPSGAAYCLLLYGAVLQLEPIDTNYSGIFSIDSFQSHQSPFHKDYVYKGTLYLPDAHLPCRIYSQSPHLPPARCDYFVSGKLKKQGPFDYTMKPISWQPIEKSWSFAQTRFSYKERYRKFIAAHIADPKNARFLSALTTGDLDDRLLKFEFGRLGLQHILAISGFHFGVLTAFFSFLLSFFLPRTWRLFFLLFILNGYYFFLGASPGIERSYLTAQIYLLGKLIHRQTSGLNLLGVTLGCEIILSPLVISNIGFQLSFTSCAGILLLYPLIERGLRKWLPTRSKQGFTALPFLSKHVHLLSQLLRQAISITTAVNLAIFPILLFHFHLFPPLSLLYNLFYPFCIGILLSFHLLSCLVYPLFAPLGTLLFSLTNWLCTHLLDLVSYPPISLDVPLLVSQFPHWIVPLYLFALFQFSMFLIGKYRLNALKFVSHGGRSSAG
ncbi:MAG: ComEC/Rec2 family competence protein [Chlamydiia bacterium]|nr:ComEC/Rec2 family competence protein [Chlamydiia bacterium]